MGLLQITRGQMPLWTCPMVSSEGDEEPDSARNWAQTLWSQHRAWGSLISAQPWRFKLLGEEKGAI